MTQDNKYKNYTESNGVYYAMGSSTDESWESYVGKLNLIRNPDNLYNLALSLYKQDYKYSAEKFMKISLLGGELRAADMLSTWDSDNKKYYQDIKQYFAKHKDTNKWESVNENLSIYSAVIGIACYNYKAGHSNQSCGWNEFYVRDLEYLLKNIDQFINPLQNATIAVKSDNVIVNQTNVLDDVTSDTAKTQTEVREDNQSLNVNAEELSSDNVNDTVSTDQAIINYKQLIVSDVEVNEDQENLLQNVDNADTLQKVAPDNVQLDTFAELGSKDEDQMVDINQSLEISTNDDSSSITTDNNLTEQPKELTVDTDLVIKECDNLEQVAVNNDTQTDCTKPVMKVLPTIRSTTSNSESWQENVVNSTTAVPINQPLATLVSNSKPLKAIKIKDSTQNDFIKSVKSIWFGMKSFFSFDKSSSNDVAHQSKEAMHHKDNSVNKNFTFQDSRSITEDFVNTLGDDNVIDGY
ncbi:hypothetical protein [Candidatus Tisiphia endosymbiont of Ditula angustiorana]|uniref:hypothetical protein n=1 Tax=Candidatus Tisiphia endosymbiont of Ditula angustiorana TaxID=3066272 RepID=UPI00312C7283